MERKIIIAIDFDGTIVSHKFPRIGDLMLNARKVINKLYNQGFYIIIWTCRGEKSLCEMIDFLSDAKILYHKINENAPYEMIKFKPAPKIYYDILIDDRNIGGFVGWEYVYKILAAEYNLEKWNT